MIEIISKNVVAVVKCLDCNTELSYEDEDVYIGQFGCAYIECPVCGERVYLEDGKHDTELTHENLQYPKHFASYADGAKMNNQEVSGYIREVSKYLQSAAFKVGDFAIAGSGDTLVIGLKWKGEDEIIVTKRRETVLIPRGLKQTNL